VPAHGPQVEHIGADAVLAYDLELREGRQHLLVDTLQRGYQLAAAAGELDETGTPQRPALVVEEDVAVALLQLRAQDRMARE